MHNVFLDKTVDGEERINLRGKLRFIPAPNLTVDLTGSYEDRDSGVAYFISIPSNDVNDTSSQVVSGSEGRAERVLKDVSAKITWERSEEHTSELQSLMRISYAVFCLKKKNSIQHDINLT